MGEYSTSSLGEVRNENRAVSECSPNASAGNFLLVLNFANLAVALTVPPESAPSVESMMEMRYQGDVAFEELMNIQEATKRR